ncbi:hypothetical protein HAHI6034_07350 [Hathewaya histolytica]|uniref:Chromosome segregation protein SMC n=1 Tax=Hathewaya histolytica TaxID=1498 RepID=A0A4U9QV89_HATHI|nr:hypothetical protein [Hathewaya histolytica]VTQ82634.1 chromosome segregation protein SMC [Hathewaya histolytica]
MLDTKTWVFNDLDNNLWYFTLDDKNNMSYKIIYSENKWSKENIIDKNVLEFNIFIHNNNIHIAYIKENEVKYCVWEKNQWLGKTLYNCNHKKASEVKIIIIEDNFHVLFILNETNNPTKGTLTHCNFNSEGIYINPLFPMEIFTEVNNHYNLELLNKHDICLFFFESKNKELEVHSCMYNKNIWRNPRKLYSLKGSDIEIFTMNYKNSIHILNLSKEENTYLLEDVCIYSENNIDYHKIHQTNFEVSCPMLMIKEEILWLVWIENNYINYSLFNDKWNSKFQIAPKNLNELILYNSNYINHNNKKITCPKLLGNPYPNIEFILPNKYESNPNPIENILDDNTNNVKTLENQILKLKKSNKTLDKEIVHLKFKLNSKEKQCIELKERLNNSIAKTMASEDKFKNFKKAYMEFPEQMKDLRNQVKESSENLKITEEKNSKLEEKMKNTTDKYTVLQENTKKYENTLSNLNKELSIFKDENKKLLINTNNLTKENSNLKSKLENTLLEKKELTFQLKSLSKDKSVLESKLQNLMENTKILEEKVNSELEDASNKISMINAQKKELILKLNNIDEENIKLKKDLELEINKPILSKIFK